ncbi:unnamed protein product [Rhizoctonia solani]|uniref:Phytocyanin domain-containing protein n=3 Tax=Rhizoctonia solani TaxID=456999 RepID=A0A8H3HBY5_9AGAM|nr:plastocyanin-like domain protein [Rhizoctonia solani AG-3 Rhs1AP]KEP49078.1 plastocyanin-like domain protein [Rhizoctonia solani 123E]CAE6348646.1 unnamed protein product [Rhizoctonia solani]CAE6495852.1 unnamed protein product [Rhizoctonia solani]
MLFSFASMTSAIVLALPLTGVAANPIRSAGHLNLEARTEWNSPTTHKVTVGAWGKLRYDPEYVHAKVGDYVQFEFHPKNHTVTESSFDKPCSAIDGGFRTGFIPVKEEKKHDLPIRKFKVTDDKPHWFYCGQVGHCPAGMVFAVNPPKSGNTFEKFEKKAKESGGKW